LSGDEEILKVNDPAVPFKRDSNGVTSVLLMVTWERQDWEMLGPVLYQIPGCTGVGGNTGAPGIVDRQDLVVLERSDDDEEVPGYGPASGSREKGG
jgi:hypothetical protein